MRHVIPTVSMLGAIALSGCNANLFPAPSPSPPEATAVPSATPQASASPATDPDFPGEAAHLVDDTSDTPVEILAEPSDQARSIVAVSANEVVRVIDSTRDGEQRMWYRVRSTSGVAGWVMGQFVQFIGDANSSKRPFVVMPGAVPVLAAPGPDAPVVGQVQGGEVIRISRSVEVPQAENGNSTWLEMEQGWVAAEFMFQPTCLPFNGKALRVVGVEGAVVKAEPSAQAPDVTRLEGGEMVIPLSLATNEEGDWLQTEQGWVSSQPLFFPPCQTHS